MKRKAMFLLVCLHHQPFLSPRLSSSSAISDLTTIELQTLDDYVMFITGHGKQINDCSANIFQPNWKYRHTDIRAFRRLGAQDSAYVKIPNQVKHLQFISYTISLFTTS